MSGAHHRPAHATDAEILAYKRWIRGLRQHLGMTQAQFSRQIGLKGAPETNRVAVTEYESQTSPRIPSKGKQRLLRKLAEANRYFASPI
jgi:transcriptional regulator with XRE-family HTH domain